MSFESFLHMDWVTVGSILLLVAAIFIVALQTDRPKTKPASFKPVTALNAGKALDRIESWAKWLALLQTGAMTTIGWNDKLVVSEVQAGCGIIALWCLGWSLFGFAWLLGGLPSIQQRLDDDPAATTPQDHDIYPQSLFATVRWARWVTLERAAAFSHYMGVIGLLFFALFFIAKLDAAVLR